MAAALVAGTPLAAGTVAGTLVTAVIGAAVPGAALGLALTRHPWISLQTPTSVVIAWQTDLPSPGSVLFSQVLGGSWTEVPEVGIVTDHAVTLAGLSPGTTYYYQIVSGITTLAAGVDSFRTAPDSDEPFRFVAFGDLGRATTAQIEIAARADSLNADLGILTGDIIYDSGEAVNFTPQYFDIYRPTIRRIPFYPSLGNHDVSTLNGQPYLDAYYLPSNNPAGTERYYSFDYADVHFVALEVTRENTVPDAAMRAWLDADLAGTTKRWKFVFFHVPMYSSLGAHGDDPTIAASLGPIFDARGVDVVFQGHNHYYTRTYPIAAGAVVDADQEPNYLNPGGPIYIVTGGGGRSLYSIGTSLPYEVYSKSTYHLTSVDVVGNTLALLAIERDGTVIDAMTLTKDVSTAVAVSAFEAVGNPEGVLLRWHAPDAGPAGVAFHVYRAIVVDGAEERLTVAGPISGGPDFEFLDRTAERGVAYRYRLGVLEDGQEMPTGWIEGARGGAYRFALGRARPNPSGGAMDIPITLARRSPVRLRIVDPQGRLVREIATEPLAPGPHALRWDGTDRRGRPAPSGVYFAVARAGSDAARQRLVLLR
jgi:hypothetical protein